MKITVGMAVHDDFDGVWFTLQSLRLHQNGLVDEIIVVDNNPSSVHGQATKQFMESWTDCKYVPFTEVKGTAAPRQAVFDLATGDVVVCLDSHVLLVPDSIFTLKQHFLNNPGSKDLVSGPMVYDDLKNQSTHFEDVWRDEMWGIWGTDPRGEGRDPFEIGAMGLGCFAMIKSSWPGFNRNFRQFGGEEWYIHEKVRQKGGKCLCLPGFGWVHRFSRPSGVTYPLTLWHKVRNYVIGHKELGLKLDRLHEHFVASNKIKKEDWDHLLSSDPPPLEPKAKTCGVCNTSLPDSPDKWYEKGEKASSSINEHMPTIKSLASKAGHVTEFGVQRGLGTVAILSGQPKEFVSYDLTTSPEHSGMSDKNGDCNFKFVLGDSRSVDIEETDMLFIDTKHTAEYLWAELQNVKKKVRNKIVIYGTVTFGETGDDGKEGLLKAVRKFLQENNEWTVIKHDTNNNGLMVLSRDDADKNTPPGILKKALNFSKALAAHARAGQKLADDETFNQRIELCLTCPKRFYDTCGLCGCPVDKKCSWSEQSCPDNPPKWGAVE